MVAIAFLSAACGAESPLPSGPASIQGGLAVASLEPWLTEAEIEKAVTFRISVGLRSDQGWIEAVARRPDAEAGVRAFGVPLTTAEREGLLARARTTDSVTSVIQGYGRSHPEAWAGVHIEEALVVGRFTGDTADHEEALRALLAPSARWEIREADWTLSEMEVLSERIAHDGWLESEGYDLLDLGPDLRANIVELHVSSARPDAAELIARHYDAGEMLVVTADGTGVTSLPTGHISGVIVDAFGQPVPGLDIEVIGDIPGSGSRGDRGTQSGSGGRFRLEDMQATGYELRILDPVAADGTALEGSARRLLRKVRVAVEPGATTFMQVTIGDA